MFEWPGWLDAKYYEWFPNCADAEGRRGARFRGRWFWARVRYTTVLRWFDDRLASGVRLTVMDAKRIVSLVPSVTETLRGWGATPIGCTRFCEQDDLAAVGGTKNPDIPAIEALAPDLVVLDEEENRKEDHDALVALRVPVHALAIRSLADLDDQMPALAARVGARWVHVSHRERAARRIRAFVPIWRRPWMAIGSGTYGGSLLASLGVDVVPAGVDRYPHVELVDMRSEDIDVVLVPSEPYSFGDAHLAELAQLAPAIRIDGKDLFWWGVRTIPARRRLERLLDEIVASTDTSTGPAAADQ